LTCIIKPKSTGSFVTVL